MSYTKTIMGGGTSAGQAIAIQGGVSTALTAAGTTQGTALTLQTVGAHMISTCASGAGVVLTAGAVGDTTWVYNGGANQCLVYPPTGAKFNSLSTNGSFVLPTNTNVYLKCVSSTQWLVNLSA